MYSILFQRTWSADFIFEYLIIHFPYTFSNYQFMCNILVVTVEQNLYFFIMAANLSFCVKYSKKTEL